MLVLFETSAGFALFKVLDEGKLDSVEDIAEAFATPGNASSVLKLQKFLPFKDTADALASATSLVEAKVSKKLSKFLKKYVVKAGLSDKLAISDPKLGTQIRDELGIQCEVGSVTSELLRGVRSNLSTLLPGADDERLHTLNLGLAHSMGRYKLKFSPDKVDTMIVQAVGLLDDLDKELNTYAMRSREWYGWHFPEMSRILPDNELFCKVVGRMGDRVNCSSTDFSDLMPEEMEEELKKVAEVSMGTEIAPEDLENIGELCAQVLSITEYRKQLAEYLKERMLAIAPNLTVMVGELVGARLIAHAGSLLNLAKQPASTVQILGAEKALFRAIKTRHETPKYGLIYHASLIGQAPTKFKGKISRVLAAKCALAIRVDALGDEETQSMGHAARAHVEMRLRQLEGHQVTAVASKGSSKKAAFDRYQSPAEAAPTYNTAADVAEVALKARKEKKKSKKEGKHSKRGRDEVEAADSASPPESPSKSSKKSKKRRKVDAIETPTSSKKSKKESKKSKKKSKKSKK